MVFINKGDINYVGETNEKKKKKLRQPVIVMEKLENGDIEYRLASGELHFTDGPAIIRRDGTNEYWVAGVRFNSDNEDWRNACVQYLKNFS